MADIIQYTPTLGMASENRTLEGYYAVMVAWVEKVKNELFDKWFDISYDDENYKIIFTPKNEILSIKPWDFKLSVTSSTHYLYIEFYYDDGTSVSRLSIDIGNNKPFTIYAGEDFFIGSPTTLCHYGVFNAKKFAGDDLQCVLGLLSSALNLYTNTVTNSASVSNKTTTCTGITSIYVVQKFIFNKTDILVNNLYFLDGGMTANPSTNIFKIGAEKYCQIVNNIIYKL